jgi:hypothetical protein
LHIWGQHGACLLNAPQPGQGGGGNGCAAFVAKAHGFPSGRDGRREVS